MQFFTVSTMSFQTFSELAFTLALTLDTVVSTLLFALGKGFAGRILPAIQAARSTGYAHSK
ncbi:MAG: hypothetical protein U1F42_02240 [Candidatus Competibacteraceae bacterium]